jgi:intracellular multiplication protein IcmJ
MKLYPITLGVTRPNWSTSKPKRAIGKIGPEARDAIFQRDNNTCRCCGFRAEKYQQILHINGDTRDFSDDNVLTTCIYCHQCFDLSTVEDMHSGMLIWLPELSQADLHHVMRAVYLGRVAQGPVAEMARKVFDAFYARGADAKKRLGSTDPGALALVMRDFLATKEYRQTQANLEGIRLLPLDRRMIPDESTDTGKMNFFPQILAHWRSKTGPYAGVPPQEWPQLFQELSNAMTAESKAS